MCGLEHAIQILYSICCTIYKSTFHFLQNKQFVYRGRPAETIGVFCLRIQREYPDAEVTYV